MVILMSFNLVVSEQENVFFAASIHARVLFVMVSR